jgi:hypothetical protein
MRCCEDNIFGDGDSTASHNLILFILLYNRTIRYIKVIINLACASDHCKIKD